MLHYTIPQVAITFQVPIVWRESCNSKTFLIIIDQNSEGSVFFFESLDILLSEIYLEVFFFNPDF